MVILTAGPSSGAYLHWGVVNISWTNLAIIGLMVVVFVLALLLPFPGERP
jgi:membrane protein YqaA with SNARE-associated domain